MKARFQPRLLGRWRLVTFPAPRCRAATAAGDRIGADNT